LLVVKDSKKSKQKKGLPKDGIFQISEP